MERAGFSENADNLRTRLHSFITQKATIYMRHSILRHSSLCCMLSEIRNLICNIHSRMDRFTKLHGACPDYRHFWPYRTLHFFFFLANIFPEWHRRCSHYNRNTGATPYCNSCPLFPVPLCKYFFQMEVQVMLLRHISAFMPALFEGHKMSILLGGRVCEFHISHTTQWISMARSAINVVQQISWFFFFFFLPPPILFLVLNQPLRHEDVWGSVCIDPHLLHFCTSWRWAVIIARSPFPSIMQQY
jgi:hypothetical protein